MQERAEEATRGSERENRTSSKWQAWPADPTTAAETEGSFAPPVAGEGKGPHVPAWPEEFGLVTSPL